MKGQKLARNDRQNGREPFRRPLRHGEPGNAEIKDLTGVADCDDLRLTVAERLAVRHDVLAIDDVLQAYLRTLEGQFAGTPSGIAEETPPVGLRERPGEETGGT